MTAVTIRGIYTTALTERVLAADHDVVAASAPIERRFDASFDAGPADVAIETTRDRQGIGVSGAPEAVAPIVEAIEDVGVDTLSWPDAAPLGSVATGEVTDTRGGGAVVDLPAGATGYLPFDAAEGYVDVGDRLRVQVRSPEPPWSDRDPRLGTDVRVADPAGLLALLRGESGVSAAGRGEDATALARTTELLDAEVPEGWGLEWHRAAAETDLQTRGEALEVAIDRVDVLEDALLEAPPAGERAPRPIASPSATTWLWFGRESRRALDEDRRAVTTTIPGHHRIKAAAEAASAGVDLAEALAADGAALATPADDAFPFDAVAGQFGPQPGDRVALHHGKPDGRLFALGRGDVTEYDPEGAITVRREISSEGEYDGLGTPREPGDVAITKLKEGRWWYPTIYRGEDGTAKGTYVNVCTPVELFPDAARYVDLHVDVIDPPEGDVAIVDEDELAEAVEAGHLSEELAEQARSVANRVQGALQD